METTNAMQARRHLLLTGATGFLGKVVLEEVLRRFPDVHVTLLIRRKRSADVQRRLENLANSPCFSLLDDGWRDRVDAVEADLAETGCAIAAADRDRLGASATHAVHCAASIDFDLPLQDALRANVVATLNFMELLREMPALQHVVSVSTAYTTPHVPGAPVFERLAPLPRDVDELYRTIWEGDIDEDRALAETGHPNTYTLTKCMCEHLLDRHYTDLPISIVRPSIISACLEHPFPGWIDSRAAFAAFVTMVGTGNLRSLLGRHDTLADIVPCDVVASFVLNEAFDQYAESGSHVGGTGEDAITDGRRGADSETHAEGEGEKAGRLPIRHATVGIDRCMPIYVARDGITRFFTAYPVDKPPYLFYLGPQTFWFRLGRMLEHNGRSWKASGRRAKRWAQKMRRETKALNQSFRYFTLNTFDFRRSRPWPAGSFEPASYIWTVCEGVYRHLLRRNRRRFALSGRRGGGPRPPRKPAVHSPILSVRTLRVVSRLHHRLEQELEWLTIDEFSLAQLRDSLDTGTLMVLTPRIAASPGGARDTANDGDSAGGTNGGGSRDGTNGGGSRDAASPGGARDTANDGDSAGGTNGGGSRDAGGSGGTESGRSADVGAGGGEVPVHTTALLAAYAVLVRGHTGCGGVWFLCARDRAALLGAADVSGESAEIHSEPLVVVAREPAGTAPRASVLGDRTTLQSRIADGAPVAGVPVFIDWKASPSNPASARESGDMYPRQASRRNPNCHSGLPLFSSLARESLPETLQNCHVHLHFGFTDAAKYHERTSSRT